MAKRRRRTDKEIVAILQEHQGGVTEGGDPAARDCRRHLLPLEAAVHGVTKAEPQRLKALEDENRRLKRLMPDQALNIQVLKDALEKDAAVANSGGTVKRPLRIREANDPSSRRRSLKYSADTPLPFMRCALVIGAAKANAHNSPL